MRHHLVIICTAIALLLVANWARSWRVHDRVTHARFFTLRSDPGHRPWCELTMLISLDGRLMLHRTLLVNPDAPGVYEGALPEARLTIDRYRAPVRFAADTLVERLGFDAWRWRRVSPDGSVDGRGLCVPYWLLVTLAGVPPTWRAAGSIARSIRRAGRAARGACAGCGYDLRATRARCPECGMVPPAA